MDVDGDFDDRDPATQPCARAPVSPERRIREAPPRSRVGGCFWYPSPVTRTGVLCVYAFLSVGSWPWRSLRLESVEETLLQVDDPSPLQEQREAPVARHRREREEEEEEGEKGGEQEEVEDGHGGEEEVEVYD